MTKFLLPVMLVLLLSCDFMVPTPATEDQKKEAMHNATFDQHLINNLARYHPLENFLEVNLDTIIKHRYSLNTVMRVSGNGQADSTYLDDADCYSFFQNNDRYDISNVPDYLKKTLDSLFSSLGESLIKSFMVCKNRTIKITARIDHGKHGLSITHELVWNTEVERDYQFDDNKDIALNAACVYRIGLTEHHGH